MTYLNLLIISLVVILIIDISGFIPNLKRFISRRLTKNHIETTDFSIKPFDCSFCMTFWSLLMYLIIVNEFTFINILGVVMITLFTDVTKQLLLLIKDLLIKLIDIIYERVIDKRRDQHPQRLRGSPQQSTRWICKRNLYNGPQQNRTNIQPIRVSFRESQLCQLCIGYVKSLSKNIL